ncbi:hypothetical protein GGR53DRAFT_524992, partial [Hypoxylon sp. FL1150]
MDAHRRDVSRAGGRDRLCGLVMDARRDAATMKKYNMANWDRKLCAFVRMGGVWLRSESDGDYDYGHGHGGSNPDTNDGIAPFICVETDIVRRLIQEGSIGQDCVTHKIVDEESKDDWFVKLVACCQALYFGIQCVGRLGMGLPLTTLEISTAIFAVYAVIVYLLWWSKPVDVAVPIFLTTSRPAFDRVIHLYDSSTPSMSYWEKHKYSGGGKVIDITRIRRIPNDLS